MARIADYALLSDCHSAALVSRDGSIDWWCPARFDAPSVFTRLLDPAAGHWSIRPVGDCTVERRYVENTMVLQTDFATRGGMLRLTDALVLGPGERDHAIGYRSPHALIRHVAAMGDDVEVEVEFAARPEYGLIAPQLRVAAGGLEVAGGRDRMRLTGDRLLRIDGARAWARFGLRAGESAVFVLQHRLAGDPAQTSLDGRAALSDTVAAWQSWSRVHERYDGPYAAEVRRSGLVLQALTYRPTGAIVAAPTTSLPEIPGGRANWDYRYGWLRDGSFTLKALWIAACPDEAGQFFDWIADSSGQPGDGHIPVMLGPAGECDLTERRLNHLVGYAGSQPVRVGNQAWTQRQLDVLGEVLECAWVLRDQLGDLPPTTATFLRSLADQTAATWREPDAGMWEGREGERHYVASKVMCWVALDRAIALADQLGDGSVTTRWAAERDAIRTAILRDGWNDRMKAFIGGFGSDHLDAGVLLMPIVGFLPPDDERVLATLDVIERELAQDGLVQRWTGAGPEGAFVICSYWLAECRARAGQIDRAREIFEQVTGHANDVGLLSEEIHLTDGALIGNFPQALSHVGLINAASAIAQAEAA